jgi:hypothetical protein
MYRYITHIYDIEWMGRDSNSRPPVCETGILTRLDYPSAALAFDRPIIYVKQTIVAKYSKRICREIRIRTSYLCKLVSKSVKVGY